MVSRVIPVEPFDLVIFGGTGDLARRKILPSLFRRMKAGQMPTDARIIACARGKMSRKAFQQNIREALEVELREREVIRDRGGDVDYRVGYVLLSKDASKLTDAVRTMGLPALQGDEDRELPRGSLLLAILDAREGELIWRTATPM